MHPVPGGGAPALLADAWTSVADACAATPVLYLVTWHRPYLATVLRSGLPPLPTPRGDELRRLLAVWNCRRLGRGMYKAAYGRTQPAERAGCASGTNILGSKLQALCSIDQVAMGRDRASIECHIVIILWLLFFWLHVADGNQARSDV
jgi:hypothetical protein